MRSSSTTGARSRAAVDQPARAANHVDSRQVRFERVDDPRVLNLHRHRGAVGQARAVHLPDAGGRERLGRPLGEHAPRPSPEILHDDRRDERWWHRARTDRRRGHLRAHAVGLAEIQVAGDLRDLHRQALHLAGRLDDLARDRALDANGEPGAGLARSREDRARRGLHHRDRQANGARGRRRRQEPPPAGALDGEVSMPSSAS